MATDTTTPTATDVGDDDVTDVIIDRALDLLGPTLAAFIARSPSMTKIAPTPSAVMRLAAAVALMEGIVAAGDSVDVARAWIIGTMPDGTSPAEAIRDGRFDDACREAQHLIDGTEGY